MQLENPAQGRTLADMIASLPDSARAEAYLRLIKLERTMALRHKEDTDLIDRLSRLLQSPNPQAALLRKLLKEVVSETN